MEIFTGAFLLISYTREVNFKRIDKHHAKAIKENDKKCPFTW